MIPHTSQYSCCALFRTLQIQLKLSRSMVMRKTILLENCIDYKSLQVDGLCRFNTYLASKGADYSQSCPAKLVTGQ